MKRVLVCLLCMTVLWIARAPTVGAWGGGDSGDGGALVTVQGTFRLDLSAYYYPFTLKVENHTSSTPEPASAQSRLPTFWALNLGIERQYQENEFVSFFGWPMMIPKRYAFSTRTRDNNERLYFKPPGNRFTTNPRNPRLPPTYKDPFSELPTGRDTLNILKCMPAFTIWTEEPPTDLTNSGFNVLSPRISLTYDVGGDGSSRVRLTDRQGGISPRISFAYDVKGDGSTTFTGHWIKYYNGGFFQTDADRLNLIDAGDFKWGSFRQNDGTFADESGFKLGSPIIKDKLWFFGCWSCGPGSAAPQLTYGKLSGSFSIALEYNYRELLEAAAANPNINPFLAISNAVAERQKITIVPTKISF